MVNSGWMPTKSGRYSGDVELSGSESYCSSDPVRVGDKIVDVDPEVVIGIWIGEYAGLADDLDYVRVSEICK